MNDGFRTNSRNCQLVIFWLVGNQAETGVYSTLLGALLNFHRHHDTIKSFCVFKRVNKEVLAVINNLIIHYMYIPILYTPLLYTFTCSILLYVVYYFTCSIQCTHLFILNYTYIYILKYTYLYLLKYVYVYIDVHT